MNRRSFLAALPHLDQIETVGAFVGATGGGALLGGIAFDSFVGFWLGALAGAIVAMVRIKQVAGS